MDLAEELAAVLSDDDVAELVDFFGAEPPTSTPATGAEPCEAEAGFEEMAAPDPSFIAALAQSVSETAAAIGLDEWEQQVAGGANPASASSAASSTDPAPIAPPPVAVAEVAPWELLSDVSASGYVYDANGRTAMRIQRGKPAKSVTVNCYRHSRCTLLLSQSRCPDDPALKRWLFEVEAAPLGCSTAESKELASKHMAAGKAKWSAAAQKAK